MARLFKFSNAIILTGVYLIVIGSLFFTATSTYQYCIQQAGFVKWSAPDEAANYYFSKLYAETGQFTSDNGVDLPAAEVVRPRSFKNEGSQLLPVSFLGLPILYGTIARLLVVEVLPFITPIIGILGLWFFFGLIKRVFNQSTGVVASTLAATFPVFVYYSAKSMFHNVLFLSSIIIGTYFGFRALERRRDLIKSKKCRCFSLIALAISGLAFGWAIATRTSELLWLGPLLVLIVIAYFKEIGWYRWLWWLAWLGTAMIPMATWNLRLHGSWYGGGYPAMTNSVNTISQTSLGLFSWQSLANGSVIIDKLDTLKDTIFYFGFWPKQSAIVFYHYAIEMFPWLMILAASGVFLFMINRRQWSKDRWLFLISWCLASAFLIIYYGSWKFNDNPDPSRFTIGNSYTRYWLPIYFGALPWAAEALRTIVRFLFRKQVARTVIISIVAVISFYNLRFVAIGSEEGLLYTGQRQIKDYRLLQGILTKTEANSVIITKYQDKLFFPERQVIVGLFDDDNMNRYYAQILEKQPLYYFNFRFNERDIQYLNERRLPPFGYRLQEVWSEEKFTLYRLVKIEQINERKNKKQ